MSTDLPEGTRCPSCHEVVDAGTSLGARPVPKPGDISICAYCGEVSTFDDQGGIRAATLAERLEAARNPQVVAACELIAQRQ